MLTVNDLKKSADVLCEKLGLLASASRPSVGVVLGSGLGAFAESLQDARAVAFSEIPHLPTSSVPGHAGRFVAGVTKSGVPVLVQQGRLHFYEGHDWLRVTWPIRLMAALGVSHVVLTTSTGSVNPDYKPGEFVLIRDHLNFAQVSPLQGLSRDWGERFVDMSTPYDEDVMAQISQRVPQTDPDIVLHTGVFAYVVGPHYETPSEIRALRTLGADVVSMSTVPETIVARQVGLKVTGLANITNFGSGLVAQKLDHTHVAIAAQKSAPAFKTILEIATSAAAKYTKIESDL